MEPALERDDRRGEGVCGSLELPVEFMRLRDRTGLLKREKELLEDLGWFVSDEVHARGERKKIYPAEPDEKPLWPLDALGQVRAELDEE